jgi:hypothetical protein
VEIKASFPMGNLCNSSTTEYNYTGCLVHLVGLPYDSVCSGFLAVPREAAGCCIISLMNPCIVHVDLL